MVGVLGSIISLSEGSLSPLLFSLQNWRVCMPLHEQGVPGTPSSLARVSREGDEGPACLTPTCLMASSFLGSLSGELAAAEGVRVTDVLAPELGG